MASDTLASTSRPPREDQENAQASEGDEVQGLSVTKRDGKREAVSFDKILKRIQCLAATLAVDVGDVALRTIRALTPFISTAALDEIAAETSALLSWKHSDYAVLAGRLALANLIKETPATFSASMRAASESLGTEFCAFVDAHAEELDAAVKEHEDRDFELSYMAVTTLRRSYLLRSADNVKVLERPCYMLMRNAAALHLPDLPRVRECFAHLARRRCTHATPTLSNAGRARQQLASCFLLPVADDSIEGIFKTLSECAQISKWGGGIGIDFTDLRTQGAPIHGTGGVSNGLLHVLKLYNEASRYVDQGGGKRKGAWCCYLEAWHACLPVFLDMRLPQGADSSRARDLFYALWIPDLFMERVEADGDWTLFCPTAVPGLHLSHGADFRARYLEAEGRASHLVGTRTLRARQIWTRILASQRETGLPFMLYKDTANAKTNHANLGTLRCSNLCTEILQYCSRDETAVCNLASVALPACVLAGPDGTPEAAPGTVRQRFDFAALDKTVRALVRSLNQAVDRTVYPVETARRSNLLHRPIGIGVQGLADVFFALHLPFASAAAKQLNVDIFEQIYHSALSESVALAMEQGPYESYSGSPASRGILQMDMWKEVPRGRLDWSELRFAIKTHGLRNSLVTAPMPTASTAQLLGNSEMCEPLASNVFLKKTLSGEFIECNRYLVARLSSLGLWDEEMRSELIRRQGSVQDIDRVPSDVKEVYRTVWEIPQRDIIDMAAQRGPFIDQSQSLNLHCDAEEKMSSMHFHVWRSGLKGSYYRRGKAAACPVSARMGAATECQSCSA